MAIFNGKIKTRYGEYTMSTKYKALILLSKNVNVSKYLEIQFTSRRPKKYEVTLTGLRGYGIDYGIIELFTNQSVVCSENDLGQTVLDLLKKSPSLWEDSIISVRQI